MTSFSSPNSIHALILEFDGLVHLKVPAQKHMGIDTAFAHLMPGSSHIVVAFEPPFGSGTNIL
jgi:hypothetical protein